MNSESTFASRKALARASVNDDEYGAIQDKVHIAERTLQQLQEQKRAYENSAKRREIKRLSAWISAAETLDENGLVIVADNGIDQILTLPPGIRCLFPARLEYAGAVLSRRQVGTRTSYGRDSEIDWDCLDADDWALESVEKVNGYDVSDLLAPNVTLDRSDIVEEDECGSYRAYRVMQCDVVLLREKQDDKEKDTLEGSERTRFGTTKNLSELRWRCVAGGEEDDEDDGEEADKEKEKKEEKDKDIEREKDGEIEKEPENDSGGAQKRRKID